MSDINDIRSPVAQATSLALAAAAARGGAEADPDDLLTGLLLAVSRFGIVWIGERTLDLEALGVHWPPERDRRTKVAYSAKTAALFDHAAGIARRDGSARTGLDHLLAAFAEIDAGLMGEIKQRYSITGTDWRAELARSPRPSHRSNETPSAGVSSQKEIFTPDEAAEFLGLHIQTVRGYVRSGKLPALRVAGERAIRIKREDLLGLLEPVGLSGTDED